MKISQHFYHFSLDLETLGNAPNSPILSIGCVAFDPMTGVIDTANALHIHLELESQFKAGMLPNESTLMWWFKQEADARNAQTNATRVHPVQALRRFTDYIAAHHSAGDTSIWGNRSEFDNAILINAFSTFRMDVPWPFWGNRDLRTLISHSPNGVARNAPTVAHDALADAIVQAQQVIDLYAANGFYQLK